ncbi:MAG: DEAD/DEAH box helicase, partial [Gemmataceae bacterium]|nr:DEAD/DEAH box helicase [Gemmataceae bacterium]
MPPVRHRALALLREGLADPAAGFREGQMHAIEALAERRKRLLVVQRTGWGKSAVYFLSAKLLREQGSGPALVVSPLLALMRDQLEAARRMGVRAETVNSANKGDWDAVSDKLRRDEVDVLLVSPERLANEQFVAQV